MPARTSQRALYRPVDSSSFSYVEWFDGAWHGSVHETVLSKNIMVLEDVLTQTECQQLASRADQAGFVDSTHQGMRDEGFRRGKRAPITDGGLAAEVFARIRHALPQSPRWGPPAGLWEQLRVLSYDSNDYFLPHRDNACGLGHSSLLPTCQSYCSILIYLTDSADGSGSTRIYCEEPDKSSQSTGGVGGVATVPNHGTDDYRAPKGLPYLDARWNGAIRPKSGTVVDVVPWAGRAVVFPHRMLHESMPIGRGRKLVVRGDVLYQPPLQTTAEDGGASAIRQEARGEHRA